MSYLYSSKKNHSNQLFGVNSLNACFYVLNEHLQHSISPKNSLILCVRGQHDSALRKEAWIHKMTRFKHPPELLWTSCKMAGSVIAIVFHIWYQKLMFHLKLSQVFFCRQNGLIIKEPLVHHVKWRVRNGPTPNLSKSQKTSTIFSHGRVFPHNLWFDSFFIKGLKREDWSVLAHECPRLMTFSRYNGSGMSVLCRCVSLEAKRGGSSSKYGGCSRHQTLNQHAEWQSPAVAMTLKRRRSLSCSETSCSAQRAVRTHIHVLHSSESQHLVCWSFRTLQAR